MNQPIVDPLIADATPRAQGFSMPAEFAPHDACWMLWPQRPDTWRLGAKPAQQAFVEVATAIAGSETVYVGVNDEQYENARHQLPAFVRVVELSSNDAWMRDVGPTFLTHPDGRLAICPTGNPGMATAGSGDVLTGIITGLLAQRCSVWEAACVGTYLHGLAGDLAAASLGPHGMTAGDLLDRIPHALMGTV